MGTLKLHILDHICYDIYIIGHLPINDADRAEHSHQLVKILHPQKTRIPANAVEETVHRFNTQRTLSQKNYFGRDRTYWTIRAIWGSQRQINVWKQVKQNVLFSTTCWSQWRILWNLKTALSGPLTVHIWKQTSANLFPKRWSVIWNE